MRWPFISRRRHEHNIEIVSMPPLARAIYNTSQVQQQIPARYIKPCRRC